MPLWPNSRDAVTWITKAGSTNPRWTEWVFQHDHFNVGYRPVTALSFTVDSWIGGLDARVYHATDLLLHAACVAAAYLAFRALAPGRPRWGGLVAAAIVGLHPVTGQVVPYLARRAYPLSAALSLAGLALLAPRREGIGLARGVLAALLLSAGALANEAGYLAFPAAAVLVAADALGGTDRVRRAVVGIAPAVLAGIGLLALRRHVLHGIGGYERAGDAAGRAARILASTWATAAGALPLRSDAGELPAAIVAILGVASVALVACALPRRPRDPEGAPALAGIVWLAGLFLAYAPQGVWFPREVYVVVAPVALLSGLAVTRPDRGRWVAAGALGVLALAWARQAPAIRGVDPLIRTGWVAEDGVARALDAAVAELPKGAVVHAIVPRWPDPEVDALRKTELDESRFVGRHVLVWIGLRRPGVDLADILTYDLVPAAPAARWDGDALVLPAGTGFVTSGVDPVVRDAGGVERLSLDLAVPAGRPGYLWLHDGAAARLVPLEGGSAP